MERFGGREIPHDELTAQVAEMGGALTAVGVARRSRSPRKRHPPRNGLLGHDHCPGPVYITPSPTNSTDTDTSHRTRRVPAALDPADMSNGWRGSSAR